MQKRVNHHIYRIVFNNIKAGNFLYFYQSLKVIYNVILTWRQLQQKLQITQSALDEATTYLWMANGDYR